MCMFEFQRESERVWKRQEREQQSPSWRRLTCSCRACTECAVYMCGCVCICVFVRKMMQTSSSSSHLPKQSDWSLHIGAALQHFASRLHRLWGLLTYSHWLQVIGHKKTSQLWNQENQRRSCSFLTVLVKSGQEFDKTARNDARRDFSLNKSAWIGY